METALKKGFLEKSKILKYQEAQVKVQLSTIEGPQMLNLLDLFKIKNFINTHFGKLY